MSIGKNDFCNHSDLAHKLRMMEETSEKILESVEGECSLNESELESIIRICTNLKSAIKITDGRVKGR